MVSGFQSLYHHHVLKKIAHQRISVHLIWVFDIEKVSSQTYIAKINLRSLDHLTGTGSGPRPQKMDHMECLQNRKPRTNSGATDTHLATESRIIDQLTTTPRK